MPCYDPLQFLSVAAHGGDEGVVSWTDEAKEPAMQTSTHLALQPAITTRGLTPFEQTLANGALKRVEAKEFVFVEGDAASHVYRVETGAVVLFKVLADGRRQIVGFAYPGDLIGLGGEGEHVINAQAIKPTRLRCLPMSGLHRSVARDPSLGFKLYQALARELASARDLILTTGQRSATERVVSFLLAFSRRNKRNGQDPSTFELPMTRADIGDFLGLTIETVSRTFTKLKAMGLIELPHSCQVKLMDVDALKSLADGHDRDL
jgi:CRP/FNR family transcriptional regulator